MGARRIYILTEDSRGQKVIRLIVERVAECIAQLCSCTPRNRIEVHQPQRFKGVCNQASSAQVRALKVQAEISKVKPLILVFIDTDVYSGRIDLIVDKVCRHVRRECEEGLLRVIPVEANLEYLMCRIITLAGIYNGSCSDPKSLLSRILGYRYEKSSADRLARYIENGLADCNSVKRLAAWISTLREIKDALCAEACG